MNLSFMIKGENLRNTVRDKNREREREEENEKNWNINLLIIYYIIVKYIFFIF